MAFQSFRTNIAPTQNKGRESLKRLLKHPVEILTFAHGLPIVSNARERLAGVIGGR